MVNYFAFVSLYATIFAFYLGTHVLHKNSRDSMNRLFFLLTFFIAINCFTEFEFRFTASFEDAYFWIQASAIWPITIAIFFHFSLVYTGSTSWFAKKPGLGVIYGTAFLLCLLQINPGLMWDTIKLVPWGWISVFRVDSIGNDLLSAWVITYFICFIYLFLRFYLRNTNQRRRVQTKYLLFALVFPTAGTVFSDIILPYFYISFPSLMNLGYISTCAIIAYAVVKLGLFTPSPTEVAEQAMSKLSEMVFIVNPSEIIEAVNQAASSLSGYEKDDLVGQSIDNFFQPASLGRIDATRDNNDDILKPEVIQHIEMELKKKSGVRAPIAISKSRLVDRKGGLQGFVYLVTDVVARKQAEENAQELRKVETLSKMNTDLLTWAAHELKTPLVPVEGYAQFLYKAKVTGKDLNQTFEVEDFHALLRNTERLEGIINNILEAGIIQKGEVKLDKTRAELQPLLDEAITSIRSFASEKNIQIERLECNSSLIIDKSKMLQVIINLLSNAVKYSPKNSHVIVSTYEKSFMARKFVEISIKDQGFGFTPEELSHAFEPFVRVFTQQDEKKFIPGVGLGLYICKHIVEQHGGEIHMLSEGAGKGANVIITLFTAD